MFWLKSCPRCQGDLYAERDRDGLCVRCLQCGHELTDRQRLRLLPGQTDQALRVRKPTMLRRPGLKGMG